MTKKHYQRFAEIIGKNWGGETSNHWSYFTNDLMNYFQDDNPNFDRDRFITAVNKNIPRER